LTPFLDKDRESEQEDEECGGCSDRPNIGVKEQNWRKHSDQERRESHEVEAFPVTLQLAAFLPHEHSEYGGQHGY